MKNLKGVSIIRILKNLYKLRNGESKPDFNSGYKNIHHTTESQQRWILINTFIKENFPGEEERQIKANQEALLKGEGR